VVRALKIGALSDGVLLVIGWALKIGSEFVRGWWKQGGQLGFFSSDGRVVSLST
jgi:hypothetical protein